MRTRPGLLLVLVAITFGVAASVAANGRTWSSNVGQGGWSARTLALITIAGVGLAALIAVRNASRHRGSGVARPLAVATLAPIILSTLGLTVVALLWHRTSCYGPCTLRYSGSVGGRGSQSGQAANGGTVVGTAKSLGAARHHAQPTSLVVLWIVLALLAALGAIWFWRKHIRRGALSIHALRLRRRHSYVLDPEPAGETTPVGMAAEYIEASLDDIRQASDLRRAIIACYARMEQLFAHVGRPREGWETPFEFLHRTRDQERQPLDRLTRLYEQAHYSPHPLEEKQRLEAIAALTALRDELRAGLA